MAKINIALFSILVVTALVLSIRGTNPQGCCFDFKKSYDVYKSKFMSKDGRIIDPMQNNITTSEGQSYMLLRSLIMDDRKTFDLVYLWSVNNIRRDDGLFAWLWGESKTGSNPKKTEYKTLDYNSASDADVDIALALIGAYEKWKDEEYLNEAITIIRAIWDKETKIINNYLVLMPGVNQNNSEEIEINPSYFSPYAFKIFKNYDKLHDWDELVDSSYYFLNKSMAKTQTGLAPNWFKVVDNEILLDDSVKSDFSYDAVRIYARIYLDYLKTKDSRALSILESSRFFIKRWEKEQKIYTNYKANGELRDEVEFPGSIAIINSVICMFDSKISDEIYKSKLLPLFKEKGYWDDKKEYYGQNLLWFGMYILKGAK